MKLMKILLVVSAIGIQILSFGSSPKAHGKSLLDMKAQAEAQPGIFALIAQPQVSGAPLQHVGSGAAMAAVPQMQAYGAGTANSGTAMQAFSLDAEQADLKHQEEHEIHEISQEYSMKKEHAKSFLTLQKMSKAFAAQKPVDPKVFHQEYFNLGSHFYKKGGRGLGTYLATPAQMKVYEGFHETHKEIAAFALLAQKYNITLAPKS